MGVGSRLVQCPERSALYTHTPVIYNCTCQLKGVEECGLASWCDLKVAPAGQVVTGLLNISNL